MEKIEGSWLESEQKIEIALSIEKEKEKGFSIIRVCRMWAINRRRVRHWRSKLNYAESLGNRGRNRKVPCISFYRRKSGGFADGQNRTECGSIASDADGDRLESLTVFCLVFFGVSHLIFRVTDVHALKALVSHWPIVTASLKRTDR